MTIVQLEYLVAIANCGSFSLASERCFVTQPSLSMQIKNLEEELGVVLLDRSKKPVIPTEAGAVVVRQAREAIKAFSEVRERVLELQGEVSGVFQLGVIPTIAPYLLHRFLPAFSARYPKVDVRVRELTTGEIIKALNRDELDAAILAGGLTPAEIHEEELFSDRFYVYISENHPLFERSNIRLEELDPRKLLLLSEGHCLRGQVLDLCHTKHQTAFHYNFESGSLETLMRLVDHTAAMTILPEMALPFVPEERRAQVKPLAKGAVSRKIVIASRRTFVKRTLIEVLQESIIERSLPLVPASKLP